MSVGTTALTATATAATTNVNIANNTETFTVTLSEAATPTTADFAVTNGTVTSVTQVDATHYTVVATAAAGVAQGSTMTLSVASGATVHDVNNNPIVANSALASVTVGTTTPTATFVALSSSNNVTTVDAGTVTETFKVQFNEAITQKPLISDFAAVNGTVTSVTDLGGNQYAVTVSPSLGVHTGGSVSLGISANTSIVDYSGNPAINSAVITGASVGMDTYDVATLPGSISNWTISTNPTTGGYDLVSTIDSTVFHLASTVQTLNFNGSGGGVVSSVSLSHTGGVAIIDDSSDTSTLASSHVFTIAPSSTGATTVIMGQQGGTVIGATHTTATGASDVTVDTVQINGSYANAVFTNNSNGTVTVTETVSGVTSTTILKNIQDVHFNDGTPSGTDVRIVGAGGYNSLSDATTNYTGSNPLNVYVTNSTLASGATNGVIHTANVNVILADQDTSAIAPAVMSVDASLAVVNVNIYGTHSFTITANNNTDTIMDHTVISAGHVNNIWGGSGTDYLVANIDSSINATNGYDIIHGGSGTDTLIAGYHSQVFAGNGVDILLAEGAGAYLQGGAGTNILLNAYASTDAATSANAVTLVGGTGLNTFALIGDSYDAAHPTGSTPATAGSFNTVIAGLHATDTLDLGFLDSATGAHAAISKIADLSGGKVTMTTAGTTVNLSSFDVSTTDSTNTATHATAISAGHLTAESGGTLLVQNATMTAVANAITAGTVNTHAAASIDFSTTFGPLTDTYNHH